MNMKLNYDWILHCYQNLGLTIKETAAFVKCSDTLVRIVLRDFGVDYTGNRSVKKTTLDGEVWKDLEGFEGYYEISNFGRFLSKERWVEHTSKLGNVSLRKTPQKLVKLTPDKDGYSMFKPRKDGKQYTFKVHRLVAQHFIPNPDNKPQVNHKDGVRNNNISTNLEWCTAKENNEHSINKLGRDSMQPIYQLDMRTGDILNRYPSYSEAARAVGSNESCIRHAIYRGASCATGGYRWMKVPFAKGKRLRDDSSRRQN